MKKILIGLTLMTSLSSFASCKMERVTKKLIKNIEMNNVVIKQNFVLNDIKEAKDLINEGKFCDNGFAAISLCTSLVTEHAFFGGLTAEKESKQYALELSLYKFAQMFDVPTANSFGCNLIELNFPTL
jgi:hypothetical protein